MQTPSASSRYGALILGQGLAGSLLAWELAARGWRLLVLDDASPSAASRVAAGLINPVTGPRLVKTPLADELLPALQASLRGLEGRFGTRFLHRLPLLRRFDSERMLEFWQRRTEDPAYRGYIRPAALHPKDLAPCTAPLGGFAQGRTGWLDAGALVRHLGDWLRSASILHSGEVHYADIRIEAHGVRWRDRRADRIIFCEGYRLGSNPWFDWLPLQPAKGELLTMETGVPLPPWILSAGRWLIPVGGHRFRFGATWSWDPLDESPSVAGRERLLADLDRDFPALAKTASRRNHLAGVRPGTRDRHPFLGLHPAMPSVGVFNGFGSKGSLAIPWYARRFADFLTAGTPLPPEADVRRWWPPGGSAATAEDR
jgi:glycine/D-amino acid oxidase-like deaminating enzyme